HEHLGRWKEAAADNLRAVQLNPNDLRLQCEQAGLLLLAKDKAGYRQLCKDVQARFGQSQDPRLLHLLAWVQAFAPGGQDDAVRAVELALRAQALRPGHAEELHVLATAHYRAGQLEDAARVLRQALDQHPDWPSQPLNWLLLAAVRHRQGQADEARRWLDKTRQWLDQAAYQPAREPLARYPLPDRVDELAFELLRREV